MGALYSGKDLIPYDSFRGRALAVAGKVRRGCSRSLGQLSTSLIRRSHPTLDQYVLSTPPLLTLT